MNKASLLVVLSAAGVIVTNSAQAQLSLNEYKCTGQIGPGYAWVKIQVDAKGTIRSGLGAGQTTVPPNVQAAEATRQWKAFAVRELRGGMVNLYRPDNTLWYENARVSGGNFNATYHLPAAGSGLPVNLTCSIAKP